LTVSVGQGKVAPKKKKRKQVAKEGTVKRDGKKKVPQRMTGNGGAEQSHRGQRKVGERRKFMLSVGGGKKKNKNAGEMKRADGKLLRGPGKIGKFERTRLPEN